MAWRRSCVLDYPPYPSVTPTPGRSVTNVGVYAYAPKLGGYFFVTVATPERARPTVYATFPVTQ